MNKRRIIDRFNKNWNLQFIYSIPVPRSEPDCIIATKVLVSDIRRMKKDVTDMKQTEMTKFNMSLCN
jgi:hypothetical protein